jgi:hypothetical protein
LFIFFLIVYNPPPLSSPLRSEVGSRFIDIPATNRRNLPYRVDGFELNAVGGVTGPGNVTALLAPSFDGEPIETGGVDDGLEDGAITGDDSTGLYCLR